MILRIWHGWTDQENADAYEALLKEEIFVGIGERSISGYDGIQLLRRNLVIPLFSTIRVVGRYILSKIAHIEPFPGQESPPDNRVGFFEMRAREDS
jgi:hypothetical protein